MARKKVDSKIKLIISILCIIGALLMSGYEYYQNQKQPETVVTSNYDISSIPPYTNEPYVILNNNIPHFEEADFTTTCFENYSDLDSLGRCGTAFANLGKETMPAEGQKRGSISKIRPTGWQTQKYSKDLVDGEHLYNRCHLIAYSLSAENANAKNLITGTRYFNTEGMLPFETLVMNYLRANKTKHVLYRVTPVFEGNNLVASGVQIEAESIEDNGKSICFNIYAYNVQPGIVIDYATGLSKLAD